MFIKYEENISLFSKLLNIKKNQEKKFRIFFKISNTQMFVQNYFDLRWVKICRKFQNCV